MRRVAEQHFLYLNMIIIIILKIDREIEENRQVE